ncbi:sulfotransferase family 2 domain-containing protein [Candidatus Chloroploca mongolica]|nr:sulfotransferase family 2 domain-containing protein [Candidatus Chloroploca mongolica]
MHVPKTGGTAFGKWLHVNYSRHSYIDLGVPKLGHLTQETLHSFTCYHDWHHGRGMFNLVGRSDLPVITLLRTPVERAVSEFYERQRAFAHNPATYHEEYHQQIAPVIAQPLTACIDQEFVRHYLTNVQTTCLGKQIDYAPFLKGGAQAAAGNSMLRPYHLTDQIGQSDHARRLSNARAWLNEMPVVGLTERYAESLLLIADLLGIPVPTEPPRANVNPQRTDPAMRYRDQLAPDVVARLEELNRYDLELHAHATELFEQQWARYRAKPQRTYSIAPRLRIPLRRTESRLKSWLRRTWPGLVEEVRRRRTAYRSQQRRR